MHLRLLRIVRLPLVCLALLLGFAPAASAQITIDEQFDEPVHQATVNPTFTVAGFAYDTQATSGSGVDAVHLWAYPQAGGDPVFLAAPSCVPNVTVCRFSATVTGLTPGVRYTLVGYARATRNGEFQPARSVTIDAGTVPPEAVTSPGTTVTGAGSNGADYPVRAATAIAYDDKHDVYLQAWEEASTVMARFVGFDGSVKGDAFVLATNRVSVAGKPLVAYSRAAADDLFFAVFTSDAPGGGNLFAQRLRFTGSGATGGALVGGPIDISSATTLGVEGVVFNPIARRFLVTWAQGQDVKAGQFGIDGTPVGGAQFISDPSANVCGVRYTYAGGASAFDWRTNRYLVTYRRGVLTASCGSDHASLARMFDGSTLAPLPEGATLCSSVFPCATIMSPTYVPDREGFAIAMDRTPQLALGPGPVSYPSFDTRVMFVTSTGSSTAGLIALGTKADDTGARIAYDADSGRVLVAGRTTDINNRSTPDPNSGVVAALLDGDTPLTGPIVEAPTVVRSSVALTAARDGEFALSFLTNGASILQRVRVPAGTPGLRFSSPTSNLDGPSNGVTVGSQFDVRGWAIDFGASTGIGIDTVHAWAYPTSGGAAIFLGADTAFEQRDDVAATYAPRFGPSGFAIAVSGLPAGTYTIVAYPHSAVSGTFSSTQAATVTVQQAASQPVMNLDIPTPGATVGPAFDVGGWAIDQSAPTGTGVDQIHVWAFPQGGGNGIFLGATPADRPRGDIGAAYGSAFTNSGFRLTSPALTPGNYRIVAYAHSTVSGTFNNSRFADITVREPGNPVMAVDTPSNGATVSQPFTVGGWAIDRDAPSGTGVDAVHVWAFQVGTGISQFIGAASLGGVRGDVGAAYGSQFTNSGYNVTSGSLPLGQWLIAVYAHSTVTGTFNQSRVVSVTITP